MASAGVLYVCSSRELSIAVARSRNAGMYRPDALISATRGERGRRHQREPQPAVGGEALLRREVVDVGLGDVDVAGRRPPEVASTQQQRAVVGAGDAAGPARRRRSRSRCAACA